MEHQHKEPVNLINLKFNNYCKISDRYT